MSNKISDDEARRQRLKNLVLFKMYATDEERDATLPWVLPAVLVIAFIIWLCNRFG